MNQVTGMRKGISLVEMMIAIILFGVISIVGYKYYKNFMNTSLSGQKARVASLIDQARQLSNAYDVYKAQFGVVPTDEANLTQANALIMTSIPSGIEEITGDPSVTWNLVANINLNGSADDVGVNNFADSSFDLNASSVQDTTQNGYDNISHTFFCYDPNGDGTGATEIVFVKEVN